MLGSLLHGLQLYDLGSLAIHDPVVCLAEQAYQLGEDLPGTADYPGTAGTV